VVPCSDVGDHRFGRICCLHLQDLTTSLHGVTTCKTTIYHRKNPKSIKRFVCSDFIYHNIAHGYLQLEVIVFVRSSALF